MYSTDFMRWEASLWLPYIWLCKITQAHADFLEVLYEEGLIT
jgi:hypothetical protein